VIEAYRLREPIPLNYSDGISIRGWERPASTNADKNAVVTQMLNLDMDYLGCVASHAMRLPMVPIRPVVPQASIRLISFIVSMEVFQRSAQTCS
jgi:hypothetical protein